MKNQLYKRVTGIVLFTFSLSISGCVSHETAMQKQQKQFVGQYPEINIAPFVTPDFNVTESKNKPDSLFDTDELFRLTPKQEKRFTDWYNAPARADIRPHRRRFEYLEQYTYGFDRHGETLTAPAPLEKKARSSFSLAPMTTP